MRLSEAPKPQLAHALLSLLSEHASPMYESLIQMISSSVNTPSLGGSIESWLNELRNRMKASRMDSALALLQTMQEESLALDAALENEAKALAAQQVAAAAQSSGAGAANSAGARSKRTSAPKPATAAAASSAPIAVTPAPTAQAPLLQRRLALQQQSVALIELQMAAVLQLAQRLLSDELETLHQRLARLALHARREMLQFVLEDDSFLNQFFSSLIDTSRQRLVTESQAIDSILLYIRVRLGSFATFLVAHNFFSPLRRPASSVAVPLIEHYDSIMVKRCFYSDSAIGLAWMMIDSIVGNICDPVEDAAGTGRCLSSTGKCSSDVSVSRPSITRPKTVLIRSRCGCSAKVM